VALVVARAAFNHDRGIFVRHLAKWDENRAKIMGEGEIKKGGRKRGEGVYQAGLETLEVQRFLIQADVDIRRKKGN
jgi:hypothetical protein